MVFRNSMRSIFRSPGKTALFTLIIFALTLALSLSVSVWTSVAQFLDACDEFFTTIGLIEYMGTEYPGDTVTDLTMNEALQSFDSGLIANDAATLGYESTARAMGYVDGFWRSDNYMPGRGNSVLVVYIISFVDHLNEYNARVVDVKYSLQSKPDSMIYIDADFYDFEQGHYYLIFGSMYEKGSPLLNVRIPTFENTMAGALDYEIPLVVDVTSPEGSEERYIIPEDSVLLKIADTLQVVNNSLLVAKTNDLMSMLPFHQEELFITDGRAFTEEEYANGEHVIVVSELLAARLGLGVGDSFDLSVAISDQPGIYNSYWSENGFAYQSSFEIVGIINNVTDKSWYVFVPGSTDVPTSPFPIGYTIGQVIIDNDEAAAFSARIESILGARVQMTIYDQGYSAVAVPFNTILNVAKIVTGVCVVMELAVMILFGFIFVYRQRETSETMLFLGAGKTRVTGHFLFSAGLIALIATAAGAIAGFYLHDRIIEIVAKAAKNFTLIDSRFSNGNLSISRTLEFAPQLEIHQFLLTGAIVFVLTILACFIFVVRTFPSQRLSQRNPQGPKKERKTSHMGGGSFKYASLSAFRGGARTLVVPVLALTVVVFFGQLAQTSLRYQEQLDSIYESTTITGNYTDIKGKQVGGLVLSAFDVSNLYRTGMTSSLTVSGSVPYYYVGVSELADGTDMNLSPLYIPESPFAAESLENAIGSGPNLTATNDIRTSPEFLYSENILMNFMEGYDESFLAVPFAGYDSCKSVTIRVTSDSPSIIPPFGCDATTTCMIPTTMMDQYGLAFGDTIRVALPIRIKTEEKEWIYFHFDLQIVGSYEKQGARDTIYTPLANFFNTSFIWGDGQAASGPASETFDTGFTYTEDQKETLLIQVFESAHFVLGDTYQLTDLKDYLSEYGYSQAQKISSIRMFIVLKDATFNNSVASVKQQINYINTLYPFLYVLVGIIALVVSYLMVVSRKMEFAIMRGLGNTRIRSFFSFFTEQSLLCIMGIILGFAVWLAAWGVPSLLHLTLTAGFLICYFIGSAISVTIMNHTNVLTILTDKE